MAHLLFAHAHPAKQAACNRQNKECQNTSAGLVGCSNWLVVLARRSASAASVGVTLGDTTLLSRHGRIGVFHEQRRHGGKDVHFLTSTRLAVILARCPLETTGTSGGTSGALLDGCFSRRLKYGKNLVRDVRSEVSGLRHPTVDIALERKHIGGAGAVVFAGDFDSNAVGEEVIEGGIDELG